MIEGQLDNIRMKMSVSKEYEDMVYKLFHSPHTSKFGVVYVVEPSFDFDILKDYLYIIEVSDSRNNYLVKIPGGIYTTEEINQLTLLVDGQAGTNNASKNAI